MTELQISAARAALAAESSDPARRGGGADWGLRCQSVGCVRTEPSCLVPLLEEMPQLIATLGDGQSDGDRLTLGQQLLPLLLQLEPALASKWRAMHSIIGLYGIL